SLPRASLAPSPRHRWRQRCAARGHAGRNFVTAAADAPLEAQRQAHLRLELREGVAPDGDEATARTEESALAVDERDVGARLEAQRQPIAQRPLVAEAEVQRRPPLARIPAQSRLEQRRAEAAHDVGA